jgi:hypothetical protein
VVFKCKSEKAKDALIDFYSFVESIEGVKDLHFLIGDRTDNEVVFSFRVLLEHKDKKIIDSKIAFKVNALVAENNFAVDPNPENPLCKYGAWPWKDMLNERGSEKFTAFCCFLSRMSKIVVDMAKKDYFSSSERVEIAHVMSWMLGCTEYGLLSTKEMQIGYYDRISDNNHILLRDMFEK